MSFFKSQKQHLYFLKAHFNPYYQGGETLKANSTIQIISHLDQNSSFNFLLPTTSEIMCCAYNFYNTWHTIYQNIILFCCFYFKRTQQKSVLVAIMNNNLTIIIKPCNILFYTTVPMAFYHLSLIRKIMQLYSNSNCVINAKFMKKSAIFYIILLWSIQQQNHHRSVAWC